MPPTRMLPIVGDAKECFDGEVKIMRTHYDSSMLINGHLYTELNDLDRYLIIIADEIISFRLV